MTAYPPMPSHLETERLTLRPWHPSDAPVLRALHAERGIALLPVCLREAGGDGDGGAGEGAGRGGLIGYCGLTVARSTLEEPEIAYEFFRHAHGKGYATEAARAVLDAAITTGRSRLWATVRVWNAPSFRVLDKLGFVRDHTTADDPGEELVRLTRALP